jgi:DNA-binding IscR family transcriptional regulator
LLDILNAIESPKPLFQTSFEMKAQTKRPTSLKKQVVQVLNNAEQTMKNELQKTTLKDILNVD